MNHCRSFFALLSLLMSLLLVGCSQLPEELQSPSSNAVITDFTTLMSQQDSASPALEVRLGGVIASIDNQAHQTRLVLVNLPIDRAGRPDIDQEPQGRFVVYVPQFLDPMAYQKGRLLTVLGTARQPETITVGEHSQQVPALHAEGIHLWTITQRIMSDDFPTSMWPCHDWMCLPMPPNENRIIKTVE